jgi:hypothetical protein
MWGIFIYNRVEEKQLTLKDKLIRGNISFAKNNGPLLSFEVYLWR